MPMVMASVVIPLYNAASTISDQLDALADQTATDFEVIVADNGSTDGSRSLVASHHLGVRLVDASHERGAAHARTVGTAHAVSDRILYCDADDYADPSWIEKMSSALDRWDLVGGRLEFQRLNPRNWNWNGAESHTMTANPLPYAPSCNLGIRRAVLDASGGWPAGFPGAAGEDTALCWKAQLDGHSLGYEPDAIMHYRLRPTLLGYSRQQFDYGFQLVAARARFLQLGKPQPPPNWRFVGWTLKNIPLLVKRSHAGRVTGAIAFRLGVAKGLRDFY